MCPPESKYAGSVRSQCGPKMHLNQLEGSPELILSLDLNLDRQYESMSAPGLFNAVIMPGFYWPIKEEQQQILGL